MTEPGPPQSGIHQTVQLITAAERFHANGNPQAAYETAVRASAICASDPTVPQPLAAMCEMNAGVFAGAAGHNTEAVGYLTRAIQRPDVSSDPQQSFIVDKELGIVLRRLGKLDESARHLSRALLAFDDPALAGLPYASVEAAGVQMTLGTVLLESRVFAQAALMLMAAGAVFLERKMPLQLADCEANLGIIESHPDNPERDLGVAADYFTAAERHYQLARDAHRAAECAGKRAEVAFAQDDRHGACAACAYAAEMFLAAGDPQGAADFLAMEGWGRIQMLGSWNSAIAPLRKARELYRSSHHLAGEAMATMWLADALGAARSYSDAVNAVHDARRAFTALGDAANVGECELRLAGWLIRMGELEQANAALGHALEVLGDHASPAQMAGYLAEMADLVVKAGGIQEDRLTAANEWLRRAICICEEAQDPGRAAAAEWRLGGVLRLTFDLDGSLAALTRARVFYESFPHELYAAGCSISMARTWAMKALVDSDRQDEHTATGLREAVSGLAALEAFRYQLSASAHRHAWARAHEVDFHTAFMLAGLAGDLRLLAELVETARAQALPGGESPQDEMVADLTAELSPMAFRNVPAPQADRATALAALGDLSLGPGPAISIGGRSELGRAGSVLRPVVELEQTLLTAAGADAWWWGTWLCRDTLVYAVVGPGGMLDAGIQIDTAQLRRLIGELREALPNCLPRETEQQGVSRALHGPLAADPSVESDFAERLGSELIPSVLREELAARGPTNPLPLAIAPAPVLGRVPWALLGLNGRRLVDVAAPRVVPSITLMRSVCSRTRHARGRRQVQLVVADPTDDLHQARELRTALTAATNLQPWQATRDNVVAALPKDVGRHGIFVYSGHVSKSDPAAPASAALRLGHDPDDPQSWLEAKDFLHATSPGMWDRVLLSGCSSAGAEASAEWLGLAPAMLWAGADTVFATTWDLLDSVDTTALELAMIEALRGDDPVRELADIQRAHLDQWRGSNAETACPPVIFGAFAGVSVCPGRPATVGLE